MRRTLLVACLALGLVGWASAVDQSDEAPSIGKMELREPMVHPVLPGAPSRSTIPEIFDPSTSDRSEIPSAESGWSGHSYSSRQYLTEGFENNVIPPPGWDTLVTYHPDSGWGIATYAPHSGVYYGDVPVTGKNGTGLFDEWLISPTLDLSAASSPLFLTFWWKASQYWMCDVATRTSRMIVVASNDNGATYPDTLWDSRDECPITNWLWYETQVSLNAYVGTSQFKFAFRHIGDVSGSPSQVAHIYLDDILVEEQTEFHDLKAWCIKTDPSDGVLKEYCMFYHVGVYVQNTGTVSIPGTTPVVISIRMNGSVAWACTTQIGVTLDPDDCVLVWNPDSFHIEEPCLNYLVVAYPLYPADEVPENDTIIKSFEVPGTPFEMLSYDDGTLANSYYYYADDNVMATMFTPETYPFEINYVGVYVLSEGDQFWPWPDATHDQFRIGIWLEDPTNPGYPMEPALHQWLPGWTPGLGDSSLYLNGDVCMWGDSEPPSWVYAVPQCGTGMGCPGPLLVESGSFWVGMTNLGYEVPNCASPGQEGIGLDAATDYPAHKWARESGVWMTQDSYSGDHMIRAWGTGFVLDHDVAVIDVLSPVGKIDPGSNTCEATLKNYGANPETFDVRFFIRDTSSGTIVFDQTDNVTLTSGEVNDHVFGTFTAGSDAYYVDSLYTMLGTDTNPSNDTSFAECRTAMIAGDIVYLCDVQTLTGDNQLLGVEYVDGYFIVTGGGGGGDPNKVYVIDTTCTLICTMDQPVHSTGWGWRDLAYDGVSGAPMVDTLYGSVDNNVDKFSVNIDSCLLTYHGSFAGPYNPNRALTCDEYDPDTGYFYTANWGVNFIQFSKQNPNIGNCFNDRSAYGAAWDNDTLWIAAQDINPYGNPNTIYAMHWPTCTLVDSMCFPLPTAYTDGMAGGCDFAEYNGMYVIFEMVQGTPNDFIAGVYRRASVNPYMCGDTNDDGTLTTSDGFNLLNFFGSTGSISDMRTADVNGDCTWTTADGFQLLNYFGSTGTLDCDLCWPGCTNCN
jgi:hypothetical protein